MNAKEVGKKLVDYVNRGETNKALSELYSKDIVSVEAAGNPEMAVNNLLGGVAFQVLVLAIADMAIGREALTALVPSPKVMLHAVISIVLLTLAAIGAILGDIAIPLLSVGVFPALIVGIYLLSLWLIRHEGSGRGWKPTDKPEPPAPAVRFEALSNRSLALSTIATAAVILAAGYALTRSAEAAAAQTGLGTGLLGLTFLAAATSLPELSTAIAAVRMRRAEMAIGDVLGGNMFDCVLILLVDFIYVGGLALGSVGSDTVLAALMAVLLTGFYLIGLIERRDRTVFNMGYDSFAVLIVYIGGMAAIVAGLGS